MLGASIHIFGRDPDEGAIPQASPGSWDSWPYKVVLFNCQSSPLRGSVSDIINAPPDCRISPAQCLIAQSRFARFCNN